MARLEPLPQVGSDEAGAALGRIEALVGYRPNALATMARVPLALEPLLALVDAVINSEGSVPKNLKWLAALAVSWSAGCPYSACHAAHGAEHLGEPLERVRAVVSAPAGPLFSAAERSVLSLAHAVGGARVDDVLVADVCDQFGEQGVAEVVAVLALFGWFNRWNATFATDLEAEPARFAEDHLSSIGWTPGPHRMPPSADHLPSQSSART